MHLHGIELGTLVPSTRKPWVNKIFVCEKYLSHLTVTLLLTLNSLHVGNDQTADWARCNELTYICNAESKNTTRKGQNIWSSHIFCLILVAFLPSAIHLPNLILVSFRTTLFIDARASLLVYLYYIHFVLLFISYSVSYIFIFLL